MAEMNGPHQRHEDSEAYEGKRRYGMHPLLKVAIGCGAALLIVVVAVVGIGMYVVYQMQKEAGGARAHEEATQTFEQLASERPFTEPADGVVTEEQASLFLTASDEVWTEMAPIVEEMNRLGEQLEGQDEGVGIGSIFSSVRGMGKLMRGRIALAETLERHQVSLDEYLWTGHSLIQAHAALSGPDSYSVPEANLDLARAHSEALSGFADADVMFDKSVILMVAEMTDPSQATWDAGQQERSPQ